MLPTVENVILEDTILASALYNESALDEFAYRLTVEDFTNFNNAKLAKELMTCSKKGYTPDMSLIVSRIGGEDIQNHIAHLLTVATSNNIKNQVKKLKEVTQARHIVNQASIILSKANNIEDHKDFCVDSVNMFKGIEVGFNSGRLKHIGESFPSAIREFEAVMNGEFEGIKTGIADIDSQTGGIRKGEYVIFGGRPAVGKTSLGLSAVKNMANAGYKVGVFSIEIKTATLIFKLCSMNSTSNGREIPYSMFRGITTPDKDDMQQFMIEMQQLKEKNIYVNDSSRTTISDIVTEVRRFIRAEGLDVVVIDHIGIVKADNQVNIKRHERLQQFSMELAGLFKDEDVAGLVLVQLKRSNTNEMPTMDSLGESSQFEKDAHLIYLLHQHDLNDPERKLLVCAKARDARSGVYPLNFSIQTTEFTSMTEDDARDYNLEINGNKQEEKEMF